ncbi:unnamed protein product [Moneuplotes crassus]|uniref:Uncharacterized protein n=1 Tax=Euplotes crassus TaxID=5936 RepID=A0AAD1UQ72_EUPCR|nr:unnamed protein product [Moneuplotes crassus]
MSSEQTELATVNGNKKDCEKHAEGTENIQLETSEQEKQTESELPADGQLEEASDVSMDAVSKDDEDDEAIIQTSDKNQQEVSEGESSDEADSDTEKRPVFADLTDKIGPLFSSTPVPDKNLEECTEIVKKIAERYFKVKNYKHSRDLFITLKYVLEIALIIPEYYVSTYLLALDPFKWIAHFSDVNEFPSLFYEYKLFEMDIRGYKRFNQEMLDDVWGYMYDKCRGYGIMLDEVFQANQIDKIDREDMAEMIRSVPESALLRQGFEYNSKSEENMNKIKRIERSLKEVRKYPFRTGLDDILTMDQEIRDLVDEHLKGLDLQTKCLVSLDLLYSFFIKFDEIIDDTYDLFENFKRISKEEFLLPEEPEGKEAKTDQKESESENCMTDTAEPKVSD